MRIRHRIVHLFVSHRTSSANKQTVDVFLNAARPVWTVLPHRSLHLPDNNVTGNVGVVLNALYSVGV